MWNYGSHRHPKPGSQLFNMLDKILGHRLDLTSFMDSKQEYFDRYKVIVRNYERMDLIARYIENSHSMLAGFFGARPRWDRLYQILPSNTKKLMILANYCLVLLNASGYKTTLKKRSDN